MRPPDNHRNDKFLGITGFHEGLFNEEKDCSTYSREPERLPLSVLLYYREATNCDSRSPRALSPGWTVDE